MDSVAVPGPSTIGNSVALFLLGITVILVLFELWFRNLRYVKLGNKMPGPKSIPIVGNTYMVLGLSPKGFFQHVCDIYKATKSEVVRVWVGPKLYVVLCDAEDIEVILGSNVHLEKSREYDLLEPWLGDGLLVSKGEKWRSRRKMIAPTFHTSILKTFVPVFNRNATNLLNQFKNEVGKIFDVHDYMSGTMVDSLLETVMGVKKTEGDNTGFKYAKAVMDMGNIIHKRHYKIWLRPNILFNLTNMKSKQDYVLNIIHSVTRQVIKKKKEDYFARKSLGDPSLYQHVLNTEKFDEKNGTIEETSNISNYIKDDLEEIDENDIGEKKRRAFLDFMIEASHIKGNNLTDQDIKEEVDTIMFEGHDSTASSSSFVLYLLGIHQHIQDKVFEELKEIFHDDFNRPITFNDTHEMKYLERVILESLRLYPPVPAIARHLKKDLKIVTGDYILPEDTTIMICIFMVHRNPKYYTNPLKFDPDNFLPEKCQERPYYAFIPFSGGPRGCVGMKYAMLKLKVLLASVLRKYKIISLMKEEDFLLQADMILKISEGFKIRIEERTT